MFVIEEYFIFRSKYKMFLILYTICLWIFNVKRVIFIYMDKERFCFGYSMNIFIKKIFRRLV